MWSGFPEARAYPILYLMIHGCISWNSMLFVLVKCISISDQDSIDYSFYASTCSTASAGKNRQILTWKPNGVCSTDLGHQCMLRDRKPVITPSVSLCRFKVCTVQLQCKSHVAWRVFDKLFFSVFVKGRLNRFFFFCFFFSVYKLEMCPKYTDAPASCLE